MSAAVEFPPFHGNLYAPEGRKVVIIGYTFCGLATIAVALRLYIRAFTKIGLGLDDLSIVVTLVSEMRLWEVAILMDIFSLWSGRCQPAQLSVKSPPSSV